MEDTSPPLSLPFSFRVGTVGAGIGVGCGFGIGFGQALNLSGVPGVGQALQGVSSGLSQVGGPASGFGQAARQQLLRLGVRGLDAGLGCGVGIGYGFGAGLMLKPSAMEELAAAAQQAAGHAINFLQGKLHQGGSALDQRWTAGAEGSVTGSRAQVHQQQMTPHPGAMGLGLDGTGGLPYAPDTSAGLHSISGSGTGQGVGMGLEQRMGHGSGTAATHFGSGFKDGHDSMAQTGPGRVAGVQGGVSGLPALAGSPSGLSTLLSQQQQIEVLQGQAQQMAQLVGQLQERVLQLESKVCSLEAEEKVEGLDPVLGTNGREEGHMLADSKGGGKKTKQSKGHQR